MFFYIFLYFICAGAIASWYYWDRINDHSNRIDHDDDICTSVVIGLFFPVTAPFAIPFRLLEKHKNRRNR